MQTNGVVYKLNLFIECSQKYENEITGFWSMEWKTMYWLSQASVESEGLCEDWKVPFVIHEILRQVGEH